MKKVVLKKDLDIKHLYKVNRNIEAEIKFYQEILEKFKSKYGDLIEFEKKLENAELPEHPYWEDSIEYRNAYEEIENLKLIKEVFDWILNSSTHQESLSIIANS